MLQYGRSYFDNLNAQRYATGGPVGSMPSRASGGGSQPSTQVDAKIFIETTDPEGAGIAAVRHLNRLAV